MNIDTKKHKKIQLILCIAMFVFSVAEFALSIILIFNKSPIVIALVSIFAIVLASIIVLSLISTHEFAYKKVEIAEKEKSKENKENLEIEDINQLKLD